VAEVAQIVRHFLKTETAARAPGESTREGGNGQRRRIGAGSGRRPGPAQRTWRKLLLAAGVGIVREVPSTLRLRQDCLRSGECGEPGDPESVLFNGMPANVRAGGYQAKANVQSPTGLFLAALAKGQCARTNCHS
jgi:hypothetical protein